VYMKTVLGPAADVFGLKDGPINSLWGGPRPLATALAGGALAAGAGYGTGWLAENLLPSVLKKKRLRKSLAIMGGLAGAAPGVLQGIDNVSQGESILSPWPPPVKQSSLLDRAEALVGYPKQGADNQFAANFNPVIDRVRIKTLLQSDPFTPDYLAG